MLWHSQRLANVFHTSHHLHDWEYSPRVTVTHPRAIYHHVAHKPQKHHYVQHYLKKHLSVQHYLDAPTYYLFYEKIFLFNGSEEYIWTLLHPLIVLKYETQTTKTLLCLTCSTLLRLVVAINRAVTQSWPRNPPWLVPWLKLLSCPFTAYKFHPLSST